MQLKINTYVITFKDSTFACIIHAAVYWPGVSGNVTHLLKL